MIEQEVELQPLESDLVRQSGAPIRGVVADLPVDELPMAPPSRVSRQPAQGVVGIDLGAGAVVCIWVVPNWAKLKNEIGWNDVGSPDVTMQRLLEEGAAQLPLERGVCTGSTVADTSRPRLRIDGPL